MFGLDLGMPVTCEGRSQIRGLIVYLTVGSKSFIANLIVHSYNSTLLIPGPTSHTHITSWSPCCSRLQIFSPLCKIKGVFIIILWWIIGIGNYWFWYLKFICEVVWRWLEFTGVWQGLMFIGTGQTEQVLPVRPELCERSDWPARGLTGRFCVGFGFRLFIWISVIVSYLWLLDGYYVYVILLFATNESSWR